MDNIILRVKAQVRQAKEIFKENDNLTKDEKAEVILKRLLDIGLEMDLVDIKNNFL